MFETTSASAFAQKCQKLSQMSGLLQPFFPKSETVYNVRLRRDCLPRFPLELRVICPLLATEQNPSSPSSGTLTLVAHLLLLAPPLASSSRIGAATLLLPRHRRCPAPPPPTRPPPSSSLHRRGRLPPPPPLPPSSSHSAAAAGGFFFIF